MQTDIFVGMEVFTGVVVPAILGLAAAAAKTAHEGWHGIRRFCANSIVCAFVSVTVYWGLEAFPEISQPVKCAISSLSAFWSTNLMEWLGKRMHYEILTWGRRLNLPSGKKG